MDFISLISKLTAIGCSVTFLPEEDGSIKFVTRHPDWGREQQFGVIIRRAALGDPQAVALALEKVERQTLNYWSELNQPQ